MRGRSLRVSGRAPLLIAALARQVGRYASRCAASDASVGQSSPWDLTRFPATGVALAGALRAGPEVVRRHRVNSASIVAAIDAEGSDRFRHDKQRCSDSVPSLRGWRHVVFVAITASPSPGSKNLAPIASRSLSFLVTASTNMHNSRRRVASPDSFLR